jgi:plastocyanin
MRRLTALLAVATVVSGVVAPLATAAAEYTVILDKLKFGPVPAEVHVGDVIVWQNNDILRHTATADDDSFDVDLPAKSEAKMTVEKAGSFDFYCRFHPGMTGTLVVSP